MRIDRRAAELHLRSAFSTSVVFCFSSTLVISLLYIGRAWVSEIPPEDHVGLSLLISVLLFACWVALEQQHVHFSLADNRCWVRRHWMGTTSQRSLPVTQIHSARTEVDPRSPPSEKHNSRIVLVTALGMIPLTENYCHDYQQSTTACQKINQFLAHQHQYLAA